MASYYHKLREQIENKGENASWRDMDYSRSKLTESIPDKLKLVKNIVLRETPGNMFKTSTNNDIMVMEEAQRIVTEIAKSKNLHGIFRPENAIVDGMTKAFETEAKKGNTAAIDALDTAEELSDGSMDNKSDSEIIQEGSNTGENMSDEKQNGSSTEETEEDKLKKHHEKRIAKDKNLNGFTAEQRQEAAEMRKKIQIPLETKMKLTTMGVGLGGTGIWAGGKWVAKKALGESSAINEGFATANAVTNAMANGMNLGKRAAETEGKWDEMGNLERFEDLSGYIQDAGDISNTVTKAFGQAMGGNERYAGGASVASSSASALTGAISAITSDVFVSRIRTEEEKTKKNKGFHKDKSKGETAVDAALRARKDAALDAFNRTIKEDPEDIDAAFKAATDASRAERVRRVKYYRKRNAQHMAKSVRTQKRNENILKFVSGVLTTGANIGSMFAGNLPIPIIGPYMGMAIRTAATGVDKLVGIIGGKIFGSFRGKADVKSINNEIKAIKIGGGPLADALKDFDSYDDLKKVFKFEYAKRTKNSPPAVRNITDGDFKTLMSNALAGTSGGKSGIQSAIAARVAGSLLEDGEENKDTIHAMGLRTSGKLPSRAAITQRMGGGAARKTDLGEYTHHQLSPARA